MTLTEMKALLEAEGWRSYPDHLTHSNVSYFKRFDTPTRCRCNDDKQGIQVVVRLYGHPERGASYVIDIHGEVADGSWYHLERHGFPEELGYGLAAIPQMLRVWEAAAAEAKP